ncbi:MAG: D-alanyl-D-alanine carboxypeptidase/D-alanyl-D-alanine-endopeptidase [Myxococcales bacterium]|nr:D-alanyl-D-alanine carboxypeptidase/D-alanyl-D-alanine-endopeptidase [Myxococcales bacterium]
MRCLPQLLLVAWALPALAESPPLVVKGAPALVAEVTPLLQREALKGARISILVERDAGGPPVLSVNPDLRLHPASNTKLATTAAALSILGPSFQWSTDLAAEGYADGVADKLYLVGRGDPRFVSESLWKLVDDAQVAGLTRVKGDLIVDDTYFTADRMAPGFDEKDQDDAYRAATGAMSLNFNSVVIEVRPGAKVGAPVRVRLRPDSGYVELVNTATTSAKGRQRVTIRARAKGQRTQVTVSGKLPQKHAGLTVRRRIDNPPLFAGMAARHYLERAGIKVDGEVTVGRAPEKRKRLARVISPTLGEAIGDINKLSNNFMAEHLVRTLGAEKGTAGDWKAGAAVVRRFLEDEVGLRGFHYINGSGLFGDTAFSARDMVTILRHMAQRRPALPEYAASLAIGGADGTLRRRTRGLRVGAVRAKTGTLDGVICLSGYLTFADDSTGAFSMLMNDVPGRPWAVWIVQDALLKAVADQADAAKKTR